MTFKPLTLLAASLLVAVPAFGQIQPVSGVAITPVTTLPTVCSQGQQRIVKSTGVVYVCTAANTWTAQASGGGISGLTAGRVPVAASATTLADYSGLSFDGTSLTAPRYQSDSNGKMSGAAYGIPTLAMTPTVGGGGNTLPAATYTYRISVTDEANNVSQASAAQTCVLSGTGKCVGDFSVQGMIWGVIIWRSTDGGSTWKECQDFSFGLHASFTDDGSLGYFTGGTPPDADQGTQRWKFNGAGGLAAQLGIFSGVQAWGSGTLYATYDADGNATSSINADGTATMVAFQGRGSTPSVATCGTIGTGSKNAAGFITSATTGSCVSVLTFAGVTAATGWSCAISNSTTANLIRQTDSSTTSATFTGVTVSGDVLRYACTAY